MTAPQASAPTGDDLPHLRCRPPGPESRSWLVRTSRTAAPMGPSRPAPGLGAGIVADVPPGSIVYATARGANVVDVDGNRYVDLAGGFGALLLGHGHPSVLRILELQAARLLQALGDVHPADAKVALLERLSALYPGGGGRVILGQSGADAITAALKTAVLATGRPGVIAFHGAYHGLSYAPLAVCGLRESYRSPFAPQLNPRVTFVDYPPEGVKGSAARALEECAVLLGKGDVGAVLVEPILGRGGVLLPEASFLPSLAGLARKSGALLVADEIWTGLGRSGHLLASAAAGVVPDVLCLGKGLGGGLPISACVGSDAVMSAWRRDAEVVHTSTFAGAPLACATAIATLDVLHRENLVGRAARLGASLLDRLSGAPGGAEGSARVRGAGLMIGLDLGPSPGVATQAARLLLERGFIVSTGGGSREVVVLTPPLTIAEAQLDACVDALADVLPALAR